MNLRNCSRCGKMFNYVQGPNICDQCKKAIEEEFQNVKKYIMENPCAGIPEIIKECNVTQKQIQQWVREERLEFSKDSPIKLTCEKWRIILAIQLLRKRVLCSRLLLKVIQSLVCASWMFEEQKC